VVTVPEMKIDGKELVVCIHLVLNRGKMYVLMRVVMIHKRAFLNQLQKIKMLKGGSNNLAQGQCKMNVLQPTK
jgi:hypothetical protein